MSAQALLVPGPSHPDMFDGETPVMATLDDLNVYRIEVAPAGCEAAGGVLELAAINAFQAQQIGMDDFAHATQEPIANLTVLSIVVLDRPVTATEKRAYAARHQGGVS
ncbi:hypothetical protein QO259_10250 [Salinicola sp. JS01]|uniref:hypothetical protein n=1 Tax=Salinicola sp. JS01 TaxID=3050071 RepID=UPI00255C07A9|nr:hypothetical protein [Salinicola sp. JS01]WIX31216.1 hypothetical protein QO259_10250 [Salinicola sp. JS01]